MRRIMGRVYTNSSAMLPGPNPNSLFKYPPKDMKRNEKRNRMAKTKNGVMIQAARLLRMVSNDSNSKQTYNIMMVRPNGLCSCNITNAITSSSNRADGYPVLYPMVPELSNGMKNIHMACARVHPFLISALRHVVRISSVRSTLINRSSAGECAGPT